MLKERVGILRFLRMLFLFCSVLCPYFIEDLVLLIYFEVYKNILW